MIAQGIPIEAPRLVGEVGPSTQVPVFDRLGPPLPVPDHPEDLRPRQVNSAFDIPPRRIQPIVRPVAEKRDPHPDAGGSIEPRRNPRGTRP